MDDMERILKLVDKISDMLKNQNEVNALIIERIERLEND